MKKLFFILFSLFILTACTDSEITKPETKSEQRNVERDSVEAIQLTTIELNEGIENPNYEKKPKVKFCAGADLSGPSGQGYAEVTLNDGSVHYTFFSYFTSAQTGKPVIDVVYLGTDSFPYMGCN